VFDTGRPLQLNLIFERKTGAYQSGVYLSGASTGLLMQTLDSAVEVFHGPTLQLIALSVSSKEKKCNIANIINVTKLFSSFLNAVSTVRGQRSLERNTSEPTCNTRLNC
jgi:hypothetical protein